MSVEVRRRPLNRRGFLALCAGCAVAGLAGDTSPPVIDTVGSALKYDGPSLTLTYWNGFTAADGKIMAALVREFNNSQVAITVDTRTYPWGSFYPNLRALSKRRRHRCRRDPGRSSRDRGEPRPAGALGRDRRSARPSPVRVPDPSVGSRGASGCALRNPAGRSLPGDVLQPGALREGWDRRTARPKRWASTRPVAACSSPASADRAGCPTTGPPFRSSSGCSGSTAGSLTTRMPGGQPTIRRPGLKRSPGWRTRSRRATARARSSAISIGGRSQPPAVATRSNSTASG